MVGQVIATLHAGWLRRLLVPLAFVAVGALAFAIATGAGEREMAPFAGGGPVLVGILSAVAYWRRRAVIGREGLETRGLVLTRRVKFEELEGFTYDARSYRLYLFVPIGRVAVLKLWGGGGRTSLHAGYGRFDEYAPIVIDFAIAATVRRMRAALDRGERARFGRRLEVDRAGVYVKGLVFGGERAAIEELHIEVADGVFHLTTPRGELGAFALKTTPNLLALPQLLEELSVTKGRPRPAVLLEALRWGRTETAS